jgi:hypothetical protein
MKFKAAFTRGHTSFPVVGEVEQHDDGAWHGSFRFSLDHAPTIAPGNAVLSISDEVEWEIRVLKTTIRKISARSAFEILKGNPRRTDGRE